MIISNNYSLLIFVLTTILISFTYIKPVYPEEPLKISTETEDISLTDDINVAKAQVEKYPDNPEAHFNLAIALSRTSLVEEAIKELRKTKNLIRKTGSTEIIDKKIVEYNEIIKNSEDSTLNNIRYRLAFSHYLKAYLKNKDLEKKEKERTGNIEKKNNIFAPANLAYTEKEPLIKENLEKSIHYFKEVLKYNPNDNWAKIYYGFILAEQMGKINDAKELWSQVKNNDPNNPAPYFFLGELHIKEGDLKKGITEISQAILLRSLGY